MAQGRLMWDARHKSRHMPGQLKNCVLRMDPHSGSHEGSPHEAPRVHASNPSPQWSATEAAYLLPAVKGRSAVT